MWKETKSIIKSFQNDEDPYIIHIIKTGFRNKYMVVHEDAYERYLGDVDFKTKEEVERNYKIKLD